MFKTSKWLKFDFHTHTPCSSDYGHGDETLKNIPPEQWLQKAMERGLDCVVVTDHNSGRWIDILKQANAQLQAQEQKPQWFRNLTIFPGVEITVAGSNSRIHLLAVFDPDYDANKTTLTLGACGYHGDPGNANFSTEHGFLDCVNEILKAGGIPIPAHIDGPKGLLDGISSLTPEVKKSMEKIFAAEFNNTESFSTIPELKKLVDSVAKVMGSDAHTPDEIGQKFSWVKLNQQPTIDDLRLALMNHEFRITNQNHDPNTLPPIFLSQLTISSMKHCGRVIGQPFVMPLDPNFNAIIGGRGAGKSTVLESIRVAMRQDQKLEIEAPDVKTKLEKFLRHSDAGGVLLDDTRILLELYRHSQKYQLEWRANGEGSILKYFEDGQWKDGDLGQVQERFPVSIFSQRQISELAENPNALLEIIDLSDQVKKSEWRSRWDKCQNRYLQLHARMREILRQLQDTVNVRTKLNDIENDLKEYEEKGHGEILKQFQKFSQQKNGLVQDSFFDSISNQLAEFATNMELSDFPSHLFDTADVATNEMEKIHADTANELNNLAQAISSIAQRVVVLKQQYAAKTNSSQWHSALQANALAYTGLIGQYREKGNTIDISYYGNLVQQRSILQHQLKNTESFVNEANMLVAEKEQLENEFISLRAELFEARKKFIDDVVGANPFVRMELVPFGDCSGIEKEYREILNIEKDTFAGSIYDEENCKGLLYDLKNWKGNFTEIPQLVEQIKAKTIDIASGMIGNNTHFGKKLKTIYERQPANFDQLATWWPEDKLVVKFSRGNGNRNFEVLEKGSVGQKSAAILAFLLSHGDNPLIIDQPEDDLDNTLIYDLIVRQILHSKDTRQIIIVTHNANIVVNGDAECVHVLKFNDGQIRMDHEGSLGNIKVRDSVCTIMEGGREAFESRYNKIFMRGQ